MTIMEIILSGIIFALLIILGIGVLYVTTAIEAANIRTIRVISDLQSECTQRSLLMAKAHRYEKDIERLKGHNSQLQKRIAAISRVNAGGNDYEALMEAQNFLEEARG